MNKQDLISKIKQLDGISQDERAYLINLVNTKKKYGLVWEDKPEEVEEQLRENLPVLKEVKEKAIINSEEHPNHILIEGDNLHALTALTFTHEGKIDVIYIDPPYNTGNKDFKYNDSFVDKEDSYRHSKWLSFMDKRLRIAKRLLSENGVIFISIDDNEIAQLKMLCDEIFGEKFFIANFLWKKKSTSTNVEGVQVSSLTDNTLCYRKTYEGKIQPRIKLSETRNYPFKDETGYFRKSIIEKKNAGAYKRETMMFEILGTKPRQGKRWQLGEVKARELERKGRFINEEGVIKLKIYDFEDKDTTSAHPNILENHGTSDASSRLVNNDILGFPEKFNNPKPTELVSFLIEHTSKINSTILDFFAGSGTTLHATMELNKDGGNRQCILVTNNENNICEEVTYERNKRVIQGYTNAKGVAVEGLKNNNLRYYKSEFVSRDTSLKNKRELTYLATELLCIKEDCYTAFPSKEKWFKAFTSKTAQFIVIYDEVRIEDSFEIIEALHTQKTNDNPVKVYVFSHGQYPFTEDFEEVLPLITLCALPDAIYKAYQNVLPKKKREVVPVLEEDAVGEEENLFNQDAH